MSDTESEDTQAETQPQPEEQHAGNTNWVSRQPRRGKARIARISQWYRAKVLDSRRGRITVRLVAWLCIPVFAFTGWQLGQEYTKTRDIIFAVDTEFLVTNPRIEDPDQHQRLIALGKTRDDTVFLGEAMHTAEFRHLLVTSAQVPEDSFELTATANRSSRTIRIRITSQDPAVGSMVAVRVFLAMEQYLDQHRGSVYLDTKIQRTQPEGITAYYAGVGADWPVSGAILGLIMGFTVTATTGRFTQRKREA